MACTDPWNDLQAANGGQASRIHTIPYKGATCREWHNMVALSVKYASLRLAQFQLVQVLYHERFDCDGFVTNNFDHNLGIFGKS